MKAILVAVLVGVPSVAAVLAAPALLSEGAPPHPLDAPASTPVLVADVAPGGTVELALGAPVFWDGPIVQRSGTATRLASELACDSPAASMWPCHAATVPLLPMTSFAAVSATGVDPACGNLHECFTYELDLAEGGSVLRVALDHASQHDAFLLWLTAPDGSFVAPRDSTVFYTTELRVEAPLGGCCYQAHVAAYDVRDAGFRMRALLAGAPTPPPSQPEALLPDLRMVPPFDVGFGTCQATEIALFQPTRCLRFSTGPTNVGDGALDMRIHDAGTTSGTLHQRIHASDGSWSEREAGRYVYHLAHQHYHIETMAAFELFKVLDAQTGELARVGASPKIGYCTLEYLMADWSSFEQDAQWSASESTQQCIGGPDAPRPSQIPLSRGWGDVYFWYIEGNYVDFGGNGDGSYVILLRTDPEGTMLELDESNNLAYAWLDVEGGEVVAVRERGIGASPWDAAKIVVEDSRPAMRATAS